MGDPVKARLLRTRDLLADLTDLNEAAISDWDRRDDERLPLEQDTDQYHRRMQRLYAQRGGAA